MAERDDSGSFTVEKVWIKNLTHNKKGERIAFGVSERDLRKTFLIPRFALEAIPDHLQVPAPNISAESCAGRFVINRNDRGTIASDRLPDRKKRWPAWQADQDAPELPETLSSANHCFGFLCACCGETILAPDDIYRFKSGAVWSNCMPDTLEPFGDLWHNAFKGDAAYYRVRCRECQANIGSLYETRYTPRDQADLDEDKPFPCCKLMYTREVRALTQSGRSGRAPRLSYLVIDASSKEDMEAKLARLASSLPVATDYKASGYVDRLSHDLHRLLVSPVRQASSLEASSSGEDSKRAEDLLETLTAGGTLEDREATPSLKESVEVICKYLPGEAAAIRASYERAMANASRTRSPLSVDEYASIQMCTGVELHGHLNDSLRGDWGKLLSFRKYLKLLFQALKKWRDVSEPVTQELFRATPLKPGTHFAPDSTVVWWGVTSASLSVDAARRPFGGTSTQYALFRIIPHHAVNIASLSRLHGEQECVFLPGSKFKVIAVFNDIPGQTEVVMEEVVA